MNFSPARNVLSTTEPAPSDFSFVRTNAPPLPGLDVLELDDAPRLALELDVHPVPELVGGDDLGHRRVRVANA